MNENEVEYDYDSYVEIWRTIMTNVLQWNDWQQELWLQRTGYPLLSTKGFCFHEEPWYWLHSEIAAEFYESSSWSVDLLRGIEGKLCRILGEVFQHNAVDLEKRESPQFWEEVRARCREACRVDNA
ncbi:hypothetical protein LOC68_07140 [Blastopirellula sp. JC732]|uniref:Uncharacterized protein n=1 Tax=Blastopirellula sediminis TaxID=2894196 RepID=A0A9X1SER3_9BACT|nr:hypothetical protein [Blastopirellula sediminis]MCC9609058.1 hypothetical protein [Blastopirellula sediminis]MCC9628165.1 hypothetical protein [Blastopirellula sediminis]